ncbi:hypothetical protein [Pseudooctadecabacter jejudonensis]|uniref:Uncharacterized protein n=1 Tax=Pseudooctadecabacter jejudonensis TaxID=1391910 RepID=A0A1Y5RSM3_9RHOB|nr:hypothetical protein [Pseudooctadecabacter jejudonensis]SLN23437.1 hypothetical protein PSJ8397_00993 [Pseudooctadecabacter jejudonensis]
MGQNNDNAKKPLGERLSHALDSVENARALVTELNKTASSPDVLKPSERILLNSLQAALQGPPVDNGTPPPNVAAKTPDKLPPENTGKSNDMQTANPRRKANPNFDALLMMGIKYSATQGRTISQDQLFQLGQAYDANTKRASIIAKLNRWKNEKDLLKWTKPQMIDLTELGQAETADLEKMAATTGDLNRLKALITDVLKITPHV